MNNQGIYLNSFASGFLYFFGLSDNPFQHLDKKYKQINDANELAKDWTNVGADIKKSYEQFKAH